MGDKMLILVGRGSGIADKYSQREFMFRRYIACNA